MCCPFVRALPFGSPQKEMLGMTYQVLLDESTMLSVDLLEKKQVVRLPWDTCCTRLLVLILHRLGGSGYHLSVRLVWKG